MTILLENLPPELEVELRARAQQTGQSIEQVAVAALTAGLATSGLDSSLRAIIGTWVEDPEFDKAIAEFERIDEKAWQ